MSRYKGLSFVLLAFALSACGGGSSGSSTPSLSVSGATSVSSGGTVQFNAAAANLSSPITWTVNGFAGGNATVGTITASGLYTAPAVPPAVEPLIVEAASGSVSSQAGLTVSYGPAALTGNYVLSAQMSDGTTPIALVGIFTADGKGNLTGTNDINLTSSVMAGAAATGSYVMNPDGSGTLTVTNGDGTYSFDFVMDLSGELAMTTTNAGMTGGAQFLPASGGLNAASQLDGNFVFSAGGMPVSGTDTNRLGQFTADGNGNVTAGDEDSNNVTAFSSTHNLTGVYSVLGGQRGTVTLTVGAATQHYAFYAISPADLVLISLDPGVPATGQANFQTTPTWGGNAVLLDLSNADASNLPDTLTAVADFEGGNSYSATENDNGVTSSISGTVVHQNLSGRGTFSFTTPNGATRTFVYYVQDQNDMNVMELDALGDLWGGGLPDQQIDPPVAGQFSFFGGGSPVNSQAVQTYLGVVTVSPSGAVSGYEYQDVGGTVTKLSLTGNTSGGTSATTPVILSVKLSDGSTQTFELVEFGTGALVYASLGESSDVVSSGDLIAQFEAGPLPTN